MTLFKKYPQPNLLSFYLHVLAEANYPKSAALLRHLGNGTIIWIKRHLPNLAMLPFSANGIGTMSGPGTIALQP
ncbi:MAG: hypothetical protein HN888_04970 [Desulfobacula sp.]|jgi:hypothetical protein|nr:hypothetical protein [Desulfobacula sp.]